MKRGCAVAFVLSAYCVFAVGALAQAGSDHRWWHDLLIGVIAAALVAAGTAAVVSSLMKGAVLRSLASGEATTTIRQIVGSAMAIQESDIRRVLTPEIFASMVDSPETKERIVAAISTDAGRDAVASALGSDAAKQQIAAALLDDEARSRIVTILETHEPARAAITSAMANVDLRNAVITAIHAGNADSAILNAVFGNNGTRLLREWFVDDVVALSDNLKVARAIARALRHGLIEEKETFEALQDQILSRPVQEDEIYAATRKIR